MTTDDVVRSQERNWDGADGKAPFGSLLTEASPTGEAITLTSYYEEAGPDYAAWSPEFNMHFGYYRFGMNPLRREPMLEQMNLEVLRRLQLDPGKEVHLLDMGCGLGATLRSFARKLPHAQLTGVTLVPWQVKRARALNEAANAHDSRNTLPPITILCGDYEKTYLPAGKMDGVYALESSCHARFANKAPLLKEAYRLLRPGGRVVIADGFLRTRNSLFGLQRSVYRTLCRCWVIEALGELDLFLDEMRTIGFRDIQVEPLQFRVGPSVLHIPWVTIKFLLTDVLLGSRKMTQARWNNVIAPLLLPLVGMPGGPMVYCMISATRA